MDPFEVWIDHELFRVSERRQPSGALSYDFAWLNGPEEGSYGFFVGLATVGADEGQLVRESRLSKEELVAQARDFLESFHGPGGIGEEDFPDHVPAGRRQRGS